MSTSIYRTQVEVDALIRCREIAAQILKDKNLLPTGYQLRFIDQTRRASISQSRSFKRKNDEMEMEDDDVYDGIKRLYCEDPPSLGKTCASALGSEKSEVSTKGQFTQAKPVCANW